MKSKWIILAAVVSSCGVTSKKSDTDDRSSSNLGPEGTVVSISQTEWFPLSDELQVDPGMGSTRQGDALYVPHYDATWDETPLRFIHGYMRGDTGSHPVADYCDQHYTLSVPGRVDVDQVPFGMEARPIYLRDSNGQKFQVGQTLETPPHPTPGILPSNEAYAKADRLRRNPFICDGNFTDICTITMEDVGRTSAGAPILILRLYLQGEDQPVITAMNYSTAATSLSQKHLNSCNPPNILTAGEFSQ